MNEDSLLNAIRRAMDHPRQYETASTELVYVGIDPGATGAVGILYRGKAFVGDIPTLKVKRSGGTKTETNLPALMQALRMFGPVRHNIRVAVEQAQIQVVSHGNSAYTAFRVGVFYGQMVGVIAALGLPYVRAAPQSWKKTMGLTGKDKQASRLMAIEMFPNAAADLSRKRDHDRSEALLLAEWHRRKLNGEK